MAEREARWQKALCQMASHPAMAAGHFAEVTAFIVSTVASGIGLYLARRLADHYGY